MADVEDDHGAVFLVDAVTDAVLAPPNTDSLSMRIGHHGDALITGSLQLAWLEVAGIRGPPASPSGPVASTRKARTRPGGEALLADLVGWSLLMGIETLTPAERPAFVLHDMFALSFEGLAYPDAPRSHRDVPGDWSRDSGALASGAATPIGFMRHVTAGRIPR
jgi:hypothetical protein